MCPALGPTLKSLHRVPKVVCVSRSHDALDQGRYTRFPLSEILPDECYHPNPLSEILPDECYHPNPLSEILPDECYHPNPLSEILPDECYHPNHGNKPTIPGTQNIIHVGLYTQREMWKGVGAGWGGGRGGAGGVLRYLL